MKITIPIMSNCRQTCSRCWEWFIKVWYVADKDRHVAAVHMKMEKTTKSAPVTPGYLLARDCWIYRLPRRKEMAGIRWE